MIIEVDNEVAGRLAVEVWKACFWSDASFCAAIAIAERFNARAAWCTRDGRLCFKTEREVRA